MVSTSTPFNSSLYTPSSSSSTLCNTVISDALIDPALLDTPMPAESPVAPPSGHLDDTAAGETAINTSGNGISPAMDDTGTRISADMFLEHLQTYKRKERLRHACEVYGLPAPKSANLETLRTRLVQYWYASPQHTAATGVAGAKTGVDVDYPIDDEDTLISQFDVQGEGAALLGYDWDGLDEEDEDLDDEVGSDEAFQRFKTKTRVDAVKRFEDNRRPGGKKTQQANSKAWTIFINEAREKGHVRDDIVDEHAMLLYINYTADRCKRDRRGELIPGTRVGASQIKKEFFGALQQCAAALYQVSPTSPIFRLPALAHDDVRRWMTSDFPAQLTALEASAGDPISLERMQNALLRQSLQHVVVTLQRQSDEVAQLRAIVHRRTAALSPPKACVIDRIRTSCGGSALQFGQQDDTVTSSSQWSATTTLAEAFSHSTGTDIHSRRVSSDMPLFVDEETRARQDSGVYQAEDSSFRAFVAPSPASPIVGRQRTQVDLILPPASAFTVPGQPALPPILGTGSVTWEAVFRKVVQPSYLWDAWKPVNTLDRSTIRELWECYNTGEVVADEAGTPVGMKPPLRLVEQRFLTSWRRRPAARKAWERLREIPEWIESTSRALRITPEAAILQLEERQRTAMFKGLSALVKDLAKERKECTTQASPARPSSPPPEIMTSDTDAPSESGSPVEGGKRKRAPAIGARSKKRKSHTTD